MHYRFYYWNGIQGRGEFVRLALEDAGARYTDVVREQGEQAMEDFLAGNGAGAIPLAPPFLKAGRLVLAQTAAILHYLGIELALVPDNRMRQWQALQMQLTIADLVTEIHDTHHPVAGSLYYEDQKEEALRRAHEMRLNRLPKFLGHFEQVIEQAGGRHPLRSHSHVDLSLFQLMSGLHYMFPKRMKTLARRLPRLNALHARVAERPRIATYLASERRLPFNTSGIFRHYPELDVK